MLDLCPNLYIKLFELLETQNYRVLHLSVKIITKILSGDDNHADNFLKLKILDDY